MHPTWGEVLIRVRGDATHLFAHERQLDGLRQRMVLSLGMTFWTLRRRKKEAYAIPAWGLLNTRTSKNFRQQGARIDT